MSDYPEYPAFPGASLDAWLTTPPDDSSCECGEEDCPTCAAADAYDRWVDQQIDERKEGDR